MGAAHSRARGGDVTAVFRELELFVAAHRACGELVRDVGQVNPVVERRAFLGALAIGLLTAPFAGAVAGMAGPGVVVHAQVTEITPKS